MGALTGKMSCPKCDAHLDGIADDCCPYCQYKPGEGWPDTQRVPGSMSGVMECSECHAFLDGIANDCCPYCGYVPLDYGD